MRAIKVQSNITRKIDIEHMRWSTEFCGSVFCNVIVHFICEISIVTCSTVRENCQIKN